MVIVDKRKNGTNRFGNLSVGDAFFTEANCL